MKNASDECFLNGSFRQYLEELSARTMAPGGGSAAAAVAAAGAGLNLMVIGYSMKDDTSYSDQNEFVVLKERQMASLEALSSLIDEDCRVFCELMKAIKAGNAGQEHYRAAAEAPLKVCRESAVSLEVTSILMDNSNRNLLTDVGSAAHILSAAFSSAALNVYINLKNIEDQELVSSIMSEISQLEGIVEGTSSEVGSRVKKALTEVE